MTSRPLLTLLHCLLLVPDSLGWVQLPGRALGGLLSSRSNQKASFSGNAARVRSSLSYRENDEIEVQRRRLQFAGVSVSPTGFWVVLQVDSDRFWPLQVTDDFLDRTAATSPEALTLLQLLGKIDLAGAVFPPDVLARLTVLHAEQNPHDLVASAILEDLQLPDDTDSYAELNPWLRSRVKLPICTLDEVLLSKNATTLMVDVRDYGRVAVELTDEVVPYVCYQFRAKLSLQFLTVALALRYRTPITLADGEASWTTTAQLQEDFPLYTTTANIQQSSSRVTANIEQAFEINKLQAAHRLALQKGDLVAAAKIREALDKKDSLADLPVQPDSDTNSMQ